MTDAGSTPTSGVVTRPADDEHVVHLLREMLRIRRFEERCVELYSRTAIRGFLACDNVVNMSNRKALRLHVPLPRVLKPLDSIGSKHQVQVERPVSKLNEVLSPANLVRLLIGETESEFGQGGRQLFAVGGALLHKHIDILGGV